MRALHGAVITGFHTGVRDSGMETCFRDTERLCHHTKIVLRCIVKPCHGTVARYFHTGMRYFHTVIVHHRTAIRHFHTGMQHFHTEIGQDGMEKLAQAIFSADDHGIRKPREGLVCINFADVIKDEHVMIIETKTGSQKEYGTFLREAGLTYTVNGSFLEHGVPGFDSRWLICLSICLRDTEQILAKVLPILKEYGVPFLLVKNQLQHNRINNHAFPPPLFGKPLQIVAGSPETAVDLAAQLVKATDSFSGVFIPGCIRLGSIVYATYCTKNPEFDPENPDSLPFRFSVAETASPFPSAMVWKEKPIKRFIKRRYLPLSLIRSSHKGNILKGWDLWQFKWVFIKQANQWAAEDFRGRTMRDRLLWQKEVYQKTQKAIRAPKVLDFVEQDGYSYLVTEYLDGKTLDELIPVVSKGPDGLYTLLEYYFEALYLVSFFHDAGYIHRDLTAKNIFICEGEVYLTDLELAHPINPGSMTPYGGGSYGYMSPQQRRNEPPTVAEDTYAMGALLYSIVSGEKSHAISLLPEGEREAQLKQLSAPAELTWLLIGSLKEGPAERMELLELLYGVETLLISQAQPKPPSRIKQKLGISGLLMLLAFITVTHLWLTSDEPNSHPNGFTRKFLSTDLVPSTEITVPKNTRYIAGVVGDSVYFSTMTQGEVTVLHISSRKMYSRFVVTDASVRSQLNGAGILQADRFGIAIFDGNARLLITEQPDRDLQLHKVPEIFSRAVRISPYSVALRKFKRGVRDQYFYRYDLTKDTAQSENRVTEARQDGGLVTAGLLEFDETTGQGVYVSRYANHITLLDTNMHVVRIGHTIDTFRNYSMQSRVVMGGKGASITNAGPAYFINNGLAMDQIKLYVNSNMKADNERAYQFMGSNVIDVYQITDLSYNGSYRLPVKEKMHLRNFKVRANKLYVLYSGILRIYQLPG